MASREDLIAEAGEYVLGTLGASERAAFAARLLIDPDAARAVEDWERLLAPVASLGAPAPEPVPERIWESIGRRIADTPANDNRAAAGLRRVSAALLGGALTAAAFVGWLVTHPNTPATPSPARAERGVIAVAALAGEIKPALLLTLDPSTGVINVQPVGLRAPPGRSLELWWIVGRAPPRPVGLIDPALRARFRLGAGSALAGSTFAVSIEPPGGSPTGQPTGPIPITGTVVRMPVG